MSTHESSAGLHRKMRLAVLLICSGWLSGRLPAATPSFRCEDALARQVEADWAAQERRWKRTADSPQAVREALQRGERLLADLERALPKTELEPEAATLCGLRDAVADVDKMASEQRAALYTQLRWATRNLALRNPLLADQPLVFMKRHRFVSQMLHEYLGYFYDYGDVAGGGVFVLDDPGRSLKTRDLIAGRLPRGNYTTLALSHDARTVYFAFAERAAEKPDFYSPQRRCFHIYAVNADGSGLRALTAGPDDDFDPCPLPDGGLAFMSTRRGGFGRCHNPWEPLPAYTLHRMNADGSDVRTLSWHETNEWHPAVLSDGRIVYSRWDYVDRSAANFHGLWTTHPDGSNPAVLFGNYTLRINACFQPHAIPGSDKILFVAGAHHADVGGSLVILDPQRIALERGSGEDSFDAIEPLTPEVTYPEANGWPTSYFHGPWPLSENYFLVAFSFETLPGMSSGEKRDTRTGLYYFDRFGNLELLYRDAEASCMYPIPLEPRPSPPHRVSPPAAELSDEGEFVLSDVQQSFFPLPAGRAVKQLRVFQVLPKTHTHVANQPRLGYANAESARMLLGTVPVEEDGSAYFRVPARKPLYFQAVDGDGRAVQTMRSVTYLQPGQRRGCVGCHERPGTVVANRDAACRAASALCNRCRARGDTAVELSAVGPAGAGQALRALPRWAGRSRKEPARLDRPGAGRVHAELSESEATGALERMGRGLVEPDYHPPGTLRRGPEPADASARRREPRFPTPSARGRSSPDLSVAGCECSVLRHVHGSGAIGPAARRTRSAAGGSISLCTTAARNIFS